MRANLEPLLHPPDRSLVSKRIRLPTFDHPYHFHPEIEMTFISESCGTRVVGDHIGSFQAGELYLLGANLPHVFRNTVPPEKGALAEVLHFLHGASPGFLQGMPELRTFKLLLDRSRSGLVFDPETSLRAGRLLRRIRQTDGVKRLSAFFELAGDLLDAPEPRALSKSSEALLSGHPGSDRIHRVCNIILAKFQEDFSHREMARHANMVPAAFSRLFRRTTRKTFTQFVTEVRLGHACRLLCESDKTVADIALESGFNNLANFNRKFREQSHCSPREYRAAFLSAT